MAGLAYNPNRYGLLAPQSFTPWPLGFSSALPALTISSPHTIESHLMVYTPESVEIVGSYAMKEAVLLLKVYPNISKYLLCIEIMLKVCWNF